MTTGPASARRRRSLVASLVVVLIIAFGSFLATFLSGWSPRLGLDLAGGTELVLVPASGHKISASQLAQAETIIRNRVTGLGVSGATVQVQGSQIIVQVPGVGDGRKIQNEIAQTAQLYFRPVACFAGPYTKPPKKDVVKDPTAIPECQSNYELSASNLDVQPDSNTVAGYTANNIGPDPQYSYYPTTLPIADETSANRPVILPGVSGSGTGRYVLGPAVMQGTAISGATAEQDQTGAWVVDCSLTASGAKTWNSVSQTYFHEYMGMELDGVVYSAPLILPQSSSFSSFESSGGWDGQVEISGSLTQADAQSLATALQYGSLPVPLQIITDESVSPTLGHAALVAGLGAGLAGLLLVLLYVILYYRMLGAVVVAGLAVTAALLWAIISALGQTSVAPSFDLAGVTGLIVSIGITVDSYIVYFERLKDETRAGRSVRTSLDRGFASAWRTVLAADTVSLLAAVLLYFLAVSSVKGFAFFLGLSTLLDILVTWFFTRPTVMLLGRNEALTSMRGFGIARGLLATGAPS